MNGEERRKAMLDCIRKSNAPLSGSRLAELFGISRQVVVQDIALLRAADYEIISTEGICARQDSASGVFSK